MVTIKVSSLLSQLQKVDSLFADHMDNEITDHWSRLPSDIARPDMIAAVIKFV